MIVGLRSPKTIIAGYLYFCLWQIALTQIYHVTNGLSTGIHSGRLRRGVAFDWQKDEDYSNEEDQRAEKARTFDEDYSSSILWSRRDEPSKIVSHQSKKLEIDFGQMVEETTMPSTTTPKIQTKRPTKSDIKTILWDQGVEATDDDEPTHKVISSNPAKKVETKPKTPTTTTSHPDDNDPSEIEGEKADGSNEPTSTSTMTPAAATSFDESTSHTTEKQSHKVKVTTAATTSIPTSTTNLETVVVHPTDSTMVTLSASEDKIRTYTLTGTEKYGVGKAKPRTITKKLAEMETAEYSEDVEKETESATDTTDIPESR